MEAFEYLLKACLSENKQEINLLKDKWVNLVNPNDMDYKSMRLIPLFYDHIKKYDIEIPFKKRLDIVYQYWWLKTVAKQKMITDIENVFSNNNIKYCFIKGSALFNLYDKPHHRTTGDIDIVISTKDLNKASSILKSLDFNFSKIQNFSVKYFFGIFRNITNQIFFYKEKSYVEIDLHFKFSSFFSARFQKKMWNECTNESNYLNNIELQFFLVCLNGYHSIHEHLNWVIDASKIIAKHSDISFKKIEEIVEANKLNNDWIEITKILFEYNQNIPISKLNTLRRYRPKSFISYTLSTEDRIQKLKDHFNYCYLVYYSNNGVFNRFKFYKIVFLYTIQRTINLFYMLFSEKDEKIESLRN
jgi:hypothetical protein